MAQLASFARTFTFCSRSHDLGKVLPHGSAHSSAHLHRCRAGRCQTLSEGEFETLLNLDTFAHSSCLRLSHLLFFFFFLSDQGEQTGPNQLIYCRHSHRLVSDFRLSTCGLKSDGGIGASIPASLVKMSDCASDQWRHSEPPPAASVM